MKTREDVRIAVLIDADNIPAVNIKAMMEEIAKYGTPTIKRIYGNWTTPQLGSWKSVLHEHAITPIQQYNYTDGKNSTDSAMIIDAMDILYTDKVNGFCIVSSDSDFTRLATRLRESGMMVIGIGEQKTPRPFIVACDKFIYHEILDVKPVPSPVKVTNRKEKTKDSSVPKAAEGLQKISKETIHIITSAITAVADDTGWASLSSVGSQVSKNQTDFDPRNFGFSKMGQLVKSIPQFEVEERESKEKGLKVIYIKAKSR
jgi:uncharacterized LabA/DUF88 family protein